MDEIHFSHVNRGHKDLMHFTNHIFSKSFEHFIGGKHIDWTAEFLGSHNKTMRVSARDHFKSTSLYAHFMHDLIYNPGLECQYFSFIGSLSAYHINKIKNLIRRNPYFEQVIDLKPTAEGIIKYVWPDKPDLITTLSPNGLLGFKRGKHAPRIYVDDPLRDPQNKLNPSVITKVNNIFKTEVLDLVTQNGQLHVVGTPQTPFDFFFDKELTERFAVKILPAIVDEKNKIALWSEYMSFKELLTRRREKGIRIFNQEYMCSPVSTEHAWFTRSKILSVVNPTLERETEMVKDAYVVLGWDLGKKTHPSHIAIFAEYAIDKWTQIYQKFLDGWDYGRQVKFVNDLAERFKVDAGTYDNTRGELESFVERRELSSVLEPIVFKTQTKHDMAVNFETMVENKQVELLNDQRMINQILVVDKDLEALETPEGHGDSFWSIALALHIAGRQSEGFDEPIY